MAWTTTLVVMAAALSLDTRAVAQIAPPADASLVIGLTVTNNAHISPGDLAGAKEHVSAVFNAAGVRVVWIDEASAQPDALFVAEVHLVSKDLADGELQIPEIAGEILGTALRPIRRAYIFYDALHTHAMQTGSNVPRLLAAVIVHEVGHVLLPASGHSASGIMRGQWRGRVTRVPAFTADQGRTIRALLTARRLQGDAVGLAMRF